MYIIVDNRIPTEAKSKLAEIGEILFFETNKITYPAVSGHPDIFFCNTKKSLIVAPNIPSKIRQKLIELNISFLEGRNNVGAKYPQTAHYNALVTDKYLIHNLKYTDPVLLEIYDHLEKMDVKQAYTRCSAVPLANDKFITSDRGIQKTLIDNGFDVLYVKPTNILLPGFEHGFFGGTCGIHDNRILFLGSLNHFPEGEKVRTFLSDYEIIELYDGPLFDGGSLIFID